jgi:chromosome segregation ATPase
MEQMQAKFRETAPLAADSLADAVELVRQQAIASDMRDSARFVENNRLGQSLDRQKVIDAKLDELLDILSDRREQELSRLLKKLRAAEDDLAVLRQQQQGLQRKIRNAHEQLQAADATQQEQRQAELAKLIDEQRKLQAQTDRFGRELQRLRAEQAAQRMAAAGAKMQSGSRAGDRGESGKAADLADEAKNQLDEAQRELAARRRQAEQDLANQQLATVEHALTGLASRQESALGETRRLAALVKSQGDLQPEQRASLKDLARNQAHLKDETDGVAEKVSAAEVFQLGVRSAADQMQLAAEQLAEGVTDDAAARPQEQALLRLRQLLAALKEGQSAAAGAQNPNQGGGDNPDNGGPQQKKPPPIVHSVTEIKLLTVMQEAVNRRTIELQDGIAGRAANDAEAAELAALAAEQGRIAALVAKMTARAAAERERESGREGERENESESNGDG